MSQPDHFELVVDWLGYGELAVHSKRRINPSEGYTHSWQSQVVLYQSNRRDIEVMFPQSDHCAKKEDAVTNAIYWAKVVMNRWLGTLDTPLNSGK